MASSVLLHHLPAISVRFPGLIIKQVKPTLILAGQYELIQDGVLFDSYQVRIEIPEFPDLEPKVFELGGRVKQGQHRNPDETCCTGVFEVWRAEHPGASLVDFLEGPVRNFFIGHREFEKTGVWPFGELSHGVRGIVQAAASMLGIAAKEEVVLGYLRFLARRPHVRYRRCACGSGRPITTCHGKELRKLHGRVSTDDARAILKRLLDSRSIQRQHQLLRRLTKLLRTVTRSAD